MKTKRFFATVALLLSAVMLFASCSAGKSAYDLAVDAGFTGSVDEWLASLKGEQGEKGDVGATGAQVSQGYLFCPYGSH